MQVNNFYFSDHDNNILDNHQHSFWLGRGGLGFYHLKISGFDLLLFEFAENRMQ